MNPGGGPPDPRKCADTKFRMRIDAAQAAVQAMAATQAQDTAKLNYQARVLKRALDSQKDQASELLKLLEPKGQVVDVRA